MALTPASRNDLDEDTALERFAIDGTVPPHGNVGSTQQIDLRNRQAGQPKRIAMAFNTNLSQEAVDAALARVKAFVFGAANKVVDQMIELALETSGLTPNHGQRWTFREKVGHAMSGAGELPPLTDFAPEIWERLLRSYVNLEEVRHSLAHRRARVDSTTGDLLGHDRDGTPLRPVTVAEQDQFMRLALEAVEAVIKNNLPERLRNQLGWRANQLQNLHGLDEVPGVSEPMPVVNVVLDLESVGDGNWRLNVDETLAAVRKTFQAANQFDAECHATVDGGDRVFTCRLEESAGVVDFELDTPPPWLWERT